MCDVLDIFDIPVQVADIATDWALYLSINEFIESNNIETSLDEAALAFGIIGIVAACAHAVLLISSISERSFEGYSEASSSIKGCGAFCEDIPFLVILVLFVGMLNNFSTSKQELRTIEGTIFQDFNENGLLDREEISMDYIVLFLVENSNEDTASSALTPLTSLDILYSATTSNSSDPNADEDYSGKFWFLVPPGSYTIFIPEQDRLRRFNSKEAVRGISVNVGGKDVVHNVGFMEASNLPDDPICSVLHVEGFESYSPNFNLNGPYNYYGVRQGRVVYRIDSDVSPNSIYIYYYRGFWGFGTSYETEHDYVRTVRDTPSPEHISHWYQWKGSQVGWQAQVIKIDCGDDELCNGFECSDERFDGQSRCLKFQSICDGRSDCSNAAYQDEFCDEPTLDKGMHAPTFRQNPHYLEATLLSDSGAVPPVPEYSLPTPFFPFHVQVPNVPSPSAPGPLIPASFVPTPRVPAPLVLTPRVPAPLVPAPLVHAPLVPVPLVPVPILSVPAPAPQADSSIEVTLWMDEDYNGVFTPRTEILRNIVFNILLMKDSNHNNKTDADDFLVQSFPSLNYGSATFSGLSSGRYLVVARGLEGFYPIGGQSVARTPDGQLGGYNPDLVDVSGGQEMYNVSFGFTRNLLGPIDCAAWRSYENLSCKTSESRIVSNSSTSLRDCFASCRACDAVQYSHGDNVCYDCTQTNLDDFQVTCTNDLNGGQNCTDSSEVLVCYLEQLPTAQIDDRFIYNLDEPNYKAAIGTSFLSLGYTGFKTYWVLAKDEDENIGVRFLMSLLSGTWLLCFGSLPASISLLHFRDAFEPGYVVAAGIVVGLFGAICICLCCICCCNDWQDSK